MRMSIDSLDDLDYRSFISKVDLISVVDRRRVTKLIFNTLFGQLKDDQSQSQINKVDDIVSAILKSKRQRESAQTIGGTFQPISPMDGTDITQLEPTKLDNLPNVMLSNISSFLQFTEQLNFEKTNRTVFVGSRSSSVPFHHLPSKLLAKMVAFTEKNPQSVWWQNRVFKSVDIHWKHFGVFDYQCDELIPKWIPKYQTVLLPFMSKIHSLTIFFEVYLNPLLESLVLSQLDTFPNLKRLKLIDKESREMTWELEPSLRSLISRSNVEYLECNDYLDVDKHSIDEKHGCEWTKHLKGIAVRPEVTADDESRHLYQEKLHSAVELESLHFTCELKSGNLGGLNRRMGHLKELCIGDGFADFQLLSQQNIHDLERLNLYGVSVQNEKMVQWLSKVLETLEYFCAVFCGENWIVQIMEILQKALLQQNEMKKQLKIRFNYPTLDGVSEFFKMVRILIGAMDRKCVDWMLIISGLFLKTEASQPAFDAALEALQTGNEYEVMWYCAVDLCDDRSEFDIMIKSKECKISGVQEKWIMDCEHCRSRLKQHILFR